MIQKSTSKNDHPKSTSGKMINPEDQEHYEHLWSAETFGALSLEDSGFPDLSSLNGSAYMRLLLSLFLYILLASSSSQESDKANQTAHAATSAPEQAPTWRRLPPRLAPSGVRCHCHTSKCSQASNLDGPKRGAPGGGFHFSELTKPGIFFNVWSTWCFWPIASLQTFLSKRSWPVSSRAPVLFVEPLFGVPTKHPFETMGELKLRAMLYLCRCIKAKATSTKYLAFEGKNAGCS